MTGLVPDWLLYGNASDCGAPLNCAATRITRICFDKDSKGSGARMRSQQKLLI